MPDTVVENIPDSEPTIRMKDFVEFLLNNMSESEQNEAIKIIVESVRINRQIICSNLNNTLNRIIESSTKLEDILKANC